MSHEVLGEKVAQFFSSRGETPKEAFNLVDQEGFQLETGEEVKQWWEGEKPKYWINTTIEQTDYKD